MKKIWIAIKTSLWFLPSVMLVAALGLAAGAIYLEDLFELKLAQRWPLLFGAGPDGARALLSAIVTSIITITGVVFSITILILSLAATQYTPRLLRGFMGDRVTQVVLGFLVGTIAYALVILRTVRAGPDSPYVPSLAVFLAVLLAIASMGLLVHFIHHIARSIQPTTITSEVARDTQEALRRRYPNPCAAADEDEQKEDAPVPPDPWHAVVSEQTGYVQSVDLGGLLTCATAHQVTIRMAQGVGAFVMAGEPIAVVRRDAPTLSTPDEDLHRTVRDAYSISTFRTVEQDPAFGILQLSDVAEKALSPGLNDTTTALMCLDHLSTIMAELGGRDFQRTALRPDGRVGVIRKEETFAELASAAWDRVRRSAWGNVTVLNAMARSIGRAAAATPSRARRRILLTHLEAVAQVADRSVSLPSERSQINRYLDESLQGFRDLSPSSMRLVLSRAK